MNIALANDSEKEKSDKSKKNSDISDNEEDD